MNIERSLLVNYIQAIAESLERQGVASPIVTACTVMDMSGADLADNSAPTERPAIYEAMCEVRRQALEKWAQR